MSASIPLTAIGEAIAEATGRRLDTTTATPVAGGDINRAYRLGHCFVKLNTPDGEAMFAAEAEGLEALAQAREGPRVPRPVCRGVTGGCSYLVVEWLDLRGAPRDGWARMGQALAALHRVSASAFGWHRDSAIGTTPQPNPWEHDWPAFFARWRLGHQLELAARHGAPAALVRDGERLRAGLAGLFTDYRPAPSLLHGDLWGGNAGFDAHGVPVVYDPAVYYGDRETDLAMTELFGGFPASFHAAYDEAWPRDAGYAVRRELYQLYHLLNHFNLFGGGYARAAQRSIGRLLAEL